VKQIAYSTAARRQFRKLPAGVRKQIEAKLARYAQTGVGDVKPMTGQAALRLRVGDYRVIFSETVSAVTVLVAGHRRDIYR
jgi:mRNA interferase RelE/StbE